MTSDQTVKRCPECRAAGAYVNGWCPHVVIYTRFTHLPLPYEAYDVQMETEEIPNAQ